MTISQNTLGLDPQTTKVDILMDSYHTCWNFEALNSLFYPRTVAIIRKIPFTLAQYTDKWIWGEEKHENFSVRSAYHLIEGKEQLKQRMLFLYSPYKAVENHMEDACAP